MEDSEEMQIASRDVENGITFLSLLRMLTNQEIAGSWLVEIEGRLEQQTGREVSQVSRLQEGGRRLVSRVFHRPKK